MSFILDALRKSEHERQRSALPSLAQVPMATPVSQLPRWATLLIALLAAAVLLLAGAWWQSSRTPSPETPTRAVVERPLAVPAPTVAPPTAPRAAASPTGNGPSGDSRPLAEAAMPVANEPLAAASRVAAPVAERVPAEPAPTLPSAASLLGAGVALPPLHLELHAYAEQPSARFVFINGRRYVEGERLADGLDLVAIEPQGAVLSYSGQRFLLLPE